MDDPNNPVGGAAPVDPNQGQPAGPTFPATEPEMPSVPPAQPEQGPAPEPTAPEPAPSLPTEPETGGSEQSGSAPVV